MKKYDVYKEIKKLVDEEQSHYSILLLTLICQDAPDLSEEELEVLFYVCKEIDLNIDLSFSTGLVVEVVLDCYMDLGYGHLSSIRESKMSLDDMRSLKYYKEIRSRIYDIL